MDYNMYPFVFYQLVAQLYSNGNYEEVDKMLAAPEANLGRGLLVLWILPKQI